MSPTWSVSSCPGPCLVGLGILSLLLGIVAGTIHVIKIPCYLDITAMIFIVMLSMMVVMMMMILVMLLILMMI